MNDKLITIGLGSLVALLSFLLVSFMGGFVTKADYNEDKVVIRVMANDIKHIRKTLDDHLSK